MGVRLLLSQPWVVHVNLFHCKELWHLYEASRVQGVDIHLLLMKKYREAPKWLVPGIVPGFYRIRAAFWHMTRSSGVRIHPFYPCLELRLKNEIGRASSSRFYLLWYSSCIAPCPLKGRYSVKIKFQPA